MRYLLVVFATFGLALEVQAGTPAFPWHQSRPVGQVPVRVLSRPLASPIEPAPPKQAYPYGWFGANPTKHFKRSFGASKNYTQWSQD